MLTGGQRLWDVRKLKHVAILGGTETIGTYWFYGSQIESVTISASVREIGEYAFCQCKYLK